MPVWALVVYALAVARVTGLITQDEITRPARDWLLARLDDTGPARAVAYLITCPWCASIYVAAVAAPIAWLWGWHLALLLPALVLAASQVTGVLSSAGRD
jgi:hypothetical protein